MSKLLEYPFYFALLSLVSPALALLVTLALGGLALCYWIDDKLNYKRTPK